MGHAPEHVLRIDAGLLLKVEHDLVVEPRREQAQITGDQIELGRGIENDHAVENRSSTPVDCRGP